MQLPESIETYGYFWLAEKPDNRLAGVLRISDRGDASLEMFGTFDSPGDIRNQQLTGEKLHVLGVTDKAGPVTLEEYEPIFNLYFAVSSSRFMHLEGGFLFLVHGIESLHRRSSSETRMPVEEFNAAVETVLQGSPDALRCLVQEKLKYANEISLRKRIRQMIGQFNDLFGSKSTRNRFINRVVSTRNYLTHYDAAIKDEAVTDPEELLRLHFRLEALIQLHLLRLLGIDYAHIRKIAIRYPPLRRKLGIV